MDHLPDPFANGKQTKAADGSAAAGRMMGLKAAGDMNPTHRSELVIIIEPGSMVKVWEKMLDIEVAKKP